MSSRAQGDISIPPLVSGGLFLSYRCTCECRHCLYRCSPRQPDEWMSAAMAERVFAALAREPRLGPIHVSGGEPFLRPDLLYEIIRRAVGAGLRVAYVQTNAFWCTDPGETRRLLTRLKDAGLEGLYVSVSMFHNEFVSFSRSRICVEAAGDVFGPSNVTLWRPGEVDLYGVLARRSTTTRDDRTHSLEEFRRWARGAGVEDVLPTMLEDMIPRGRILETLDGFYRRRPAGSFSGETCLTELMSTEDSGTIFHYHIDYRGNLIMGCCVGLVPATVDDLHPRITPETHPVFYRLCTDGPVGLTEMASAEFGYQEREEGYLSKCDLCLDVRGYLRAAGNFPELRPAEFYTV